MNMRRLAVCAALLMSSLPVIAAEKSPVKAGKWQVTVQTEISGMPVKIPPVTVSQCITKEQAADPESTLPNGNQNGSSCKVTKYKISGNKVTWNVDCPKEKITGTGEMTYSENSYEGVVKMTINEMDTTARYSGKYLGACTE